MIAEAFRYPLESEDSIKTLLIGTLLVLGTVLILPLFVLLGYLVRTMQAAAHGKPTPRFTDLNYTDLFRDGLKLAAVLFGYWLGILALLLLTGLTAEISFIGTLFSLITTVTYLSYLYAFPSIIYHYSRNNDIRDAYNLKQILRFTWNRTYLTIFLLLAATLLIFTTLQVALFITLIGIGLIPTLLFYELTVYGRLLGELVG